MRYQKLFLSFITALAMLTLFWSILPTAPARAQEETDLCLNVGGVMTNHIFIDFRTSFPSEYAHFNTPAEYRSRLPGVDIPCTGSNPVGYYNSTDGYYVRNRCEVDELCPDCPYMFLLSLDNITWSSPITGYPSVMQIDDAGVNLTCVHDGEMYTVDSSEMYPPMGATCDETGLDVNSGYVYIVSTIEITCGLGIYPAAVAPCATVEDYHFTGTPTSTWTLGGSASILSSTLTLNPSGSAGQTLSTSLQISTTYNAVLSVTNALSAPVVVELAGMSQTLSIEGVGLYTATFTTTEAIASPEYLIRNEGESEHYTDIDWTCVYEGGTIGEITCIAPINGEFETADNWDWFRNAAWNSSQNALLPFNEGSDADRALVVSSAAYSLPTLSAGQYLTLRFSGASLSGQDALVASRVLSNWNEFPLSSSTPATLEADISASAGQQATVSFANAGSADTAGSEECPYVAQDGLLVDDVCIYVSTTPAAAADATTVTTAEFCPVDLGFDFGCNDVDALLAGYGINVYAVEPIYTAGPTWADPSGYIPWLAAALWMHVGKPICCFLVEFMRLVVDLTEYEVNVFANYTGWSYETISNFAPWLQTGLGAVTVDAGRWSLWNANSSRNVLSSAGSNWLSQINWGQYSTSTASNNSMCVRSTISSGFNGLGSGFGTAFSQMMTEATTLWNDSILPYFDLTTGPGTALVPVTDPATPESPWRPVLDMFLWLIQFVGQIVSFVWELLRWLINFLTTGATAPIDAYHSFTAGMANEGYVIDVACADENWWCVFWGGVALVNTTSAQSILYPIVITGVICLTLVIVFKNLYEMFHIDIS